MSAWLQAMQRKRLVIVGIGVGLLLGVWVLSNLLVPHHDLIMEAIRQQGYPVAMSELDAWYPSVPAADNPALVYTNAFALLTNLTRVNAPFTGALPPIGQRLSTDEELELLNILADNEAALRLLYSAPASGRARYDVRLADGYNAMLPHLAKTREAVALLSAEGLMHASDGDPDKATQAFLAAARVAESLGEEPTVISQLVRYADWAVLVPRLERALSLVRFSESQLASLQEMLELAERPRAMARATAVERVCGLNITTDRTVMAMALQQQGWNHQLARFWTAGAMGLYQATGLQRRDRSFYADKMAQHMAAWELPYPARAAAGERVAGSTNSPSRFCIFSQMLLPALVRVHIKDANHTASVRVAAAGLGIERFRLAHTNALPAGVEQLAPAYCNTVPTDPFDGKPLRYKTHEGSYVVYSIGSDKKDDGGVNWELNYTKVPQDVGFLVKH